MARFLIVPQWQGSPAARAMLLSDGAIAIAGDLPRAATEVLDVPLEAGESLGSGVLRKSALSHTRTLIEEAMAQDSDEPTIIVGGDCSVSLAALAAIPGGTGDLAVLWCDAHPDLHTPDSSPSGALSGMALRAVLGEGAKDLALSPGVDGGRTVLFGARSFDPGEEEALGLLGVRTLDVDSLHERPEALAEAVAATGARRVWVHVDVDVLDPSEIAGVSDPAPFGASTAQLCTAIKRLRERIPLAGATIAGFAPRTPAAAVDDLGALLRVVGALA